MELRPAGDPEEEHYRLLQAVAGFLKNAASVQPLLIVLEDLHDADRGTLDLLTHVARNLSGARLLIVGTYRDVEVDRAHPLSGALAELRRVSTFDRVHLRGLTPDEVHRMMNSIMGQENRWVFAEGVHRQTEGNPLFVQEVLRYLLEEGHISRQEGRWRRTGEEAPEMNIPEGLRDVIGKRLARLGEGSNRALATAAVIGREFRLDVLQRVAGLSEEELFAALEEAQGVGVLEERSTVRGGVTFRFAHAFFRQTLYEEIFTPRRIRLHQEVAGALEEVHARRLEEHAAELAEHFAQSTEQEALEKALSYSEMAAERAAAVYDYGESARLLEQAVQVQEVLDPDDKVKRIDLLLALGEALMPAGEPQRVADELAPEAFALAEVLGDPARSSRAGQVALEGLSRAGVATVWGTPEWRLWTERADEYAAPDSSDRVRTNLYMANSLFSEERFSESKTLA